MTRSWDMAGMALGAIRERIRSLVWLAMVTIFCGFGLLLPASAMAQNQDFQLRTAVELKQDLPDGFALRIGYQARFDENARQFKGGYTTADLSYKLSKHVDLLGEFRYATSNSWDKFRFGLGVAVSGRVEKIDLSAKLRYQYEHFLQSLPEIGQYPDRQNLRLKLEAERKLVKHLRIHVSTEPQIRSEEMRPHFQRVRNIVGLKWEIAKRHTLDASYYYQPQFKGTLDKTYHMAVVSYSIDLPKWWKKKGRK